MSNFEIIILSIVLSIDAGVVSFLYGLISSEKKTALKLAFFTAFFQGLMPIIGYLCTNTVKIFIQPYAKIFVFIIFLFLGIKFIRGAFEVKNPVCIDMKCIVLTGIATSIDAFSAGITLNLMENSIIMPACLIALVTFFNSLIGFGLGGRLKQMSTNVIEIIAGIILILLGLKALI